MDAIKRDIAWLGYEWANECYASDYFQQLFDWAVQLIKDGKAYVDPKLRKLLPNKRNTKLPGTDSPYRNRSTGEIYPSSNK